MAEANRERRRGAIVRLLPLLALAGAGAILVMLVGGPEQLLRDFASGRAELDAVVARLGFAAILAFIAAYALLMMLVWFPAWLCTVVGGFLFGAWAGALYSVVGATLGAIAVFLLARHGFGAFRVEAHSMVGRLEAGFRAGAFSYTLFLRLVPVVPFSVVNLVPAILGVRLRPYVLATVLGILPSSVIYSHLGSGLRHLANEDVHLDLGILHRPDIALPLFALGVLALVPVAYRAWRGGRPAAPPTERQ
jgi:uncharacterized membrane protein YdjX (TVP38/TMEM64 family)